jgi:LPS export ABC transporter protein LptC
MIFRIVALILLGGLFAFLFKYVDPEVIKNTFSTVQEDLNTFTLKGVHIREFDMTGIHIATIDGSSAVISKDFKKAVIHDIRVTDHRLKPQGILTASDGIRKIDGKVEQLHFTGDVLLVQGDESSLVTEELYYYPVDSLVETPVSSTLRTTATTIFGDVLQTSLTQQKGTVRGNVRIIRDVEVENSPSRRVVVTGHFCSFDLAKNYFSVKGKVTVSEKEMKLTCNFLEYNMKTEICMANGAVAATDPEVIIVCSSLEFNVAENIVTVSTSSTSDTTPSASRTSFKVPGDMSTWQLTELHGKKIIHNRVLGTMDADGDVSVVRWGLDGPELKRDFIISADRLHSSFGALNDSSDSTRRRSNFNGNVKIHSKQVGASGSKAVFYDNNRNFHVIGNAKAWEYTASGEKTNLISGEKIFHDNVRQRNIIIGGVHGLFSGGED